jgi:hypothetical protein
MSLFFAGGVATLGAVVSTIPIGPINLWLLYLSWSKPASTWWIAVFGIIAADFTVAVCAYYLTSISLSSELTNSMLTGSHGRVIQNGLLGAVFVCFGYYLYKVPPSELGTKDFLAKFGGERSLTSIAATFFIPAVFTAAEPGLFGFWSAWWIKFQSVVHLNVKHILAVSAGILAGDLFVFGVYRIFATKIQRVISTSFIAKCHTVIAGFFLAFGIYFLIAAIRGAIT